MSTMANAAAARVGPEPLLLEVDDLVQRYTLPREILFRIADYVHPFPQREMCVWTRAGGGGARDIVIRKAASLRLDR